MTGNRLSRRLVPPLIGFTAATSVLAAAAASGVISSNELASGAALIEGCDPDGFALTPLVSGSDLVSVVVGDIDAACIGGEVSLSIADDTSVLLTEGGPVTVSVAGDVTVALDTAVPTTSVDTFHVRILGP